MFISDNLVGYAETHFKIIKFASSFLRILTASSRSSIEAKPVDKITGLPVLAHCFILRSVISGDAICNRAINSQKIDCEGSNGDANVVMPIFLPLEISFLSS